MVIAVVIIGIGVLAVWGIPRIIANNPDKIPEKTGTDNNPGDITNGSEETVIEPENGNTLGVLLRVGSTTYYVSNESGTQASRILRLNDDNNAEAQLVHSLPYPPDGYALNRLICEQSGTLFFLEIGSEGSGSGYNSFINLKSLDLKNEGSRPVAVPLWLKSGTTIPDEFIKALEESRERPFSFAEVFYQTSFADNKYLYAVFANGGMYRNMIVFRLDCTNGEIECIDGEEIGELETWTVRKVKDGVVYFDLWEGDVIVGLYRVDIQNQNKDFLVAFPNETIIDELRIKGGYLFYAVIDYRPTGATYELYRLDLASKEYTLISSIQPRGNYCYNIVGDTVYYVDAGDLRSCNFDGSNDSLLIGGDGESQIFSLYISGEWIYYTQGSDWYRIKADDGEFPTSSLK